MLDFIAQCTNAVVCQFDKTPTLPILLFELVTIATTAIALWLLPRYQDRLLTRFLIMGIGVLIFELFTAPMWHNYRLGWWAYLYRDVSWILTLGWSTLLLTTVVLVDRRFPHWREGQRFLLYLLVLTAVVSVLEAIVVQLGIRRYAPEVLNATSGIRFFDVPIELFYYVPVFTTLVLCFYKYWCFVLDQPLLVPVKHPHWRRDLGIAVLGVVLFEVMIEPMVQNANFPRWSYVFHDITVLMTGLWVVILWLAATVVYRFFQHYGLWQRFFIALALVAAIALPLESWFILHGYRIYGPTAVANFTGFTTPITGLPVEIAFAIPCYMALVICFVRYWSTIADNQL